MPPPEPILLRLALRIGADPASEYPLIAQVLAAAMLAPMTQISFVR